jgi:hypothetical protein
MENQNIELYRFSTVSNIFVEDMPYRQGMQNYLNNILHLNTSTPDQLLMSLSLLPTSPYILSNSTFNKNITTVQKELYYNLVN